MAGTGFRTPPGGRFRRRRKQAPSNPGTICKPYNPQDALSNRILRTEHPRQTVRPKAESARFEFLRFSAVFRRLTQPPRL